jgi:3-carboxy-cis,cis-muconate cycloisomerase
MPRMAACEFVMSFAEQIASTVAMRAVFAPRASVQAMLDVEAALAKAGAAAGFLSDDAAGAIAGACDAQGIDIEQLVMDAALAGTPVIPLVRWLREAVPAYGKAVHFGGTSQDVIDTGLVLQIRAGVSLLLADLAMMAEGAAALARAHKGTKMLARTLLQAAMPTIFGLKAAMWLAAITDARRALGHAADEALKLQCGGAAGTRDALGGQAQVFTESFAAALGLPAGLPWQTSRGPLVRLAAAIAGAVGVAGKIGTDIALMMQSEIGEVAEPAAPGRGGSSAMAHKRNPTLSIAARAAALRVPGLVATLLAAQDQEFERAAGAWQAEAAVWPALMLAASGGLAAMAEALAGLEIFPAAMEKNLDLVSYSAIPAAVAAMIERSLEDYESRQNGRDKP